MNWQMIVGVFFIIGGFGNVFNNFSAFLFGVVVGLLLLYFGLQKKKKAKAESSSDYDNAIEELNESIKRQEIEHSTAVKSDDLTPGTVSGNNRRYHYKDVNIWVKWQYGGRYGKSCKSIGIKRGDALDLRPPQEHNDDPEAVALFWKGTEIGFMKSNRMRNMVHQWQSAGLPVLAIVSSVGGENKILIEIAFYGKP